MDKKAQDRIRVELLSIIDSLMMTDSTTAIRRYYLMRRTAMAGAYLAAMVHFQSMLDTHNKCLLDNLKYQVGLLRKKV